MRSKVMIGAFEAVLKQYTLSAGPHRKIERKEIPARAE